MIIEGNITEKNLSLGVDPGYTGGLALWDLERNVLVDVIKMPIFTKKLPNGTVNRRIDGDVLRDYLALYADQIRSAVIEDVSSVTAQGVKSVFAFGYGAGQIHQACVDQRIPIFLVKPAVWKANLGLTSDKQLSLQKARVLFPTFAADFQKTSDDGKAEAALLAKYGERIYGSQKPKGIAI